jgi:RimJ/RimL family protein N-acetyltransferase
MSGMDSEVLTPRLRIRDWTPDDLAPLAEIFAQPDVWRFPFERGFTTEETEGYLARRFEGRAAGTEGPSAVEERRSGRLLGYIALVPPTWLPEVMPATEIGWRLDPSSWGQGYASEGANALLDYGFGQMGLSEILSIYEPANVASGRVMQKIGMHFGRDAVHPYFHRPLHIYTLTSAQWHEQNGRRAPG